jgi:hypothetical protein
MSWIYGGGLLSCDAAEYNALGQRTAAQTAGTVNTTTNLTCGKQMGDRSIIEIHHLGL